MDRRAFLTSAAAGVGLAGMPAAALAGVEPASTDTTGVQDAIDAASESEGIVSLPPGTFSLDGPVFVDAGGELVRLEGSGPDQTVIDAFDADLVLDTDARVEIAGVGFHGAQRERSRIGEVGVDVGDSYVVFEDVSFTADDGSTVRIVGRIKTFLSEAEEG